MNLALKYLVLDHIASPRSEDQTNYVELQKVPDSFENEMNI